MDGWHRDGWTGCARDRPWTGTEEDGNHHRRGLDPSVGAHKRGGGGGSKTATVELFPLRMSEGAGFVRRTRRRWGVSMPEESVLTRATPRTRDSRRCPVVHPGTSSRAVIQSDVASTSIVCELATLSIHPCLQSPSASHHVHHPTLLVDWVLPPPGSNPPPLVRP